MKRQAGMSLVVAIFLIVVIASLSAFAVTVGTAQREQSNLQLAADRAQAAAQAGLEWGAYRALVQNSCLAANPPLALTQVALRGYQVSVSCTQSGPHADGFLVYELTSTAQWSSFGASGYVWRQATRRLTNAPGANF
jgi:hypothetical protein